MALRKRQAALFHWVAGDAEDLTLCGSTFARNATATAVDALGTPYTTPKNWPRWYPSGGVNYMRVGDTDSARWTWPYKVLPNGFQVEIEFIERGRISTASQVLLSITDGTRKIFIETSGTYYRMKHYNGVATVTSTLAAAPAEGDTVILRGTFDPGTGKVQLSQSVNGAAFTTATISSPQAVAEWSTTARISLFETGHAGNTDVARITVTPLTASQSPLEALRLIEGTQFALYAKKVFDRRGMVASGTASFDSETEHSVNGYLVKNATAGDRPTIQTDTGAAGGYCIIRGANDDLDVRNAADAADIIGSDLMPTQGTMYAVFRLNDGGENAAQAVVMGSQTVTPKLLSIACENEIRCHAGGTSDYVVAGAEPTAALVGVVFKWTSTTIKARTLSGAWVSGTAGSGADIAAALAASFKLFSGSLGVANDMDWCLGGVIDRALTDAEVDDDGGLADMIETALAFSVALA